MANPKAQEAEEFGNDSFLDVVTNIVGILIILVMTVGTRISQEPIEHDETTKAKAAAQTSLDKAAADAGALEADVQGLENQIAQVALTAAQTLQERDMLALLAAEKDHELDERRKTLDADAQKSFDLKRAIGAVTSELERVDHELGSAEEMKKKRKAPIQIKNYPTPISHVVYGEEIHYQLRHGRVQFVPFKDLAEMIGDDFRHEYRRVGRNSEATATVGPLGGFRARYTMVSDDTGVAMLGFALLPTSDHLGETLEAALQPNSRFHQSLTEYSARQTTVTVWTYNDSFAEFRQLKEELYRMGFTVAARPLPPDEPIAASVSGSHSQAE